MRVNLLVSSFLAGSFFLSSLATNAQTVFLSEDFATASGTTPPTGWTNNTITGNPSFDKWRFDNPNGRSLISPITSPAGIFDSDNYSSSGGYEDVSFESPAFSTTGYDEVEVKWDQYFQSGLGGAANVEVFDGSTWVSVYTMSSTSSISNPESKTINISAVAGNRTGVKVRFRWTGDWSHYWLIDNITVLEGNHAPVFVSGGSQSLSVCSGSGATEINSQLKVADEDAGQTLTWSVSAPAAHGTAVASYSVTSTGDTLTPAGITYAPDMGYVGTDVFTIDVTDGISVVSTTINVNVAPLPSLAVGATPEVCPRTSVASLTYSGLVNATAGADTYTINWDVTAAGQGFIDVAATSIPSSPISLSIPFSAVPDTYTGSLVLDNGQCLSDTISIDVTINPNPDTIAGPKVVCESAIILLSDATAGGSWASADAAIAAIGTDGAVSGGTAGIAVISYTLPTSCYVLLEVTVNPMPVVYDVTGGGRFCAGGTGVAVGLSNSESGTTYDLYTGGAMVGTATGSATALDFGAQTAGGIYTVHATNNEGCSNDMNGDVAVTVVPLVTPGVSVAAAPGDTVCAGTSTTFTAAPVNGGVAPGYVWQVNGVPVSSTTDTHTFTPADADVVTVIMTSDEECPSPADATASQTMVVVSNETPTATIVSAPYRKVCAGTTVVFGATATFGGSDPIYTWYKNTVSTGITGATYSYVPTDGDVISANLNSNYRCPIVNDVPSNNLTMEVDSVFVPTAVISTNTGLDIAEGTSVTFTANVSNAGSMPRYQWVLNSLAVPTATAATYTNSSLANGDSVSCIVWGTGDCSFYTFNSVVVNVATGFVQTTIASSDIRLMPNPNSGEFVVAGNFDGTANDQAQLEITNMLGQVVYSANASVVNGSMNERIHLNSALASGMYLLNIHHGGSKVSLHFVLRK